MAQSLLDHKLDQLTDLSMSRLIEDEKGYQSINLADLRHQMQRTIRLALMRLSGTPIPPSLSSAAYETGQLRAYQNLELSSVLHSFRIDLRILWEAIVKEGKALGLDASPQFLEGLVDVWEAVEANIADVVEGYRRAADRVSRRLEEIRSVAFERLLLEGERDDSIVAEASRALDFPVDGSYLCLVGAFPAPNPDLLNRSLARLNQRNVRSHFSWGAGELVGVMLIRSSADEALRHLDDLQRFTCGVFDVDGLKSVPKGIRLARAVIRGSDQPGIRHLRQGWTGAFASVDSELSDILAAEVLAPVESLPPTERDACFEAIAAYVASDGTIADIARITYRHRNTIRKRLQQLESVTGLDLSRPADITTISLAYDAYRRRQKRHAGRGR
ncbi:helix-turn-helix domain-containing protein [Arthrobacter sp. GCM10027362]|uniref:helix-turn-helix domain-containing protein n=1 Tax=Arthrobacter sp. GCM10027362 TaxID=3273379 RepID=UPI00362B49AE